MAHPDFFCSTGSSVTGQLSTSTEWLSNNMSSLGAFGGNVFGGEFVGGFHNYGYDDDDLLFPPTITTPPCSVDDPPP